MQGNCQKLKESLNSSKISKTQTFVVFQLATNPAGEELQGLKNELEGIHSVLFVKLEAGCLSWTKVE